MLWDVGDLGFHFNQANTDLVWILTFFSVFSSFLFLFDGSSKLQHFKIL